MTAWTNATLGDVILLQRGFDLTEKDSAPGPYPVISSGGPSYTTVSPKVEGPGVVTGRKGVLGKVHFSTGPYWPHDTTLWVKDFKGSDPRYVYYLLQTLNLASLDTGASNPTLNRNHAHLLPVRVPDLAGQQQISAILGALDDLIDNSRQRIKVLELMARTLYVEWFVQFRYPGCESAVLVESAVGRIPEGWETCTVDQLVDLVTATVDPSLVDPETPAVGLEHIPRRQLTLDAWGASAGLGSRKTVFRSGDILFGKIRPYFHKVSVAPVDGICSTDAVVLRPEYDYWGLAVLTISSEEFVGNAVGTSNGTKMPRADWRVIKEFRVAAPPIGLARRFTEISQTVLHAARLLMLQNRMLAALRDFLLPKLVAGHVSPTASSLDAVLDPA